MPLLCDIYLKWRIFLRRVRPELLFLIVLILILAGGAGLTWVNQQMSRATWWG